MGRTVRQWAVRLLVVGALAVAVSVGAGVRQQRAEAAYGDPTTCAVGEIMYTASVVAQGKAWMTLDPNDDLYWERQVGYWEGLLNGAGCW